MLARGDAEDGGEQAAGGPGNACAPSPANNTHGLPAVRALHGSKASRGFGLAPHLAHLMGWLR